MLTNQPPSVVSVDPNNIINKLNASGISPASINPIDSALNQINRTGPLHQKEVLALKKVENFFHQTNVIFPYNRALKKPFTATEIYNLKKTKRNESQPMLKNETDLVLKYFNLLPIEELP